MILVDDRAGSKQLAKPLQHSKLTRLEFADLAFLGNGPKGVPVPVGIEHKQISDVMACITDGRFAGHQLPGMLSVYDWVYLIIEGFTRRRKDGVLEIRRGRGYEPVQVAGRFFLWRDLESWCVTMEVMGRVRIRRTRNQLESLEAIRGLYHWWTHKKWEEHRAHLVSDVSGGPTLLHRPGLVRRIAKELPGVGWDRSLAVSAAFKTPVDMLMADEREWMAIPGIGKILSKKIVKALRGQTI